MSDADTLRDLVDRGLLHEYIPGLFRLTDAGCRELERALPSAASLSDEIESDLVERFGRRR